MKKIILVTVTLLLTFGIKAQNVSIPDANFKRALIEAGVDKNHDNEIQVSEAILVDSLNISEKNIDSLDGIKEFKNLRYLKCEKNNLKSLNLLYNHELTELNCNSNHLATLDIANCFKLKNLNCSSNEIKYLNVAHLENLESFLCVGNKLTELDLTQDLKLSWISCYSNELASLDVTHNTNLRDISCGANKFPTLDLSKNNKLNQVDTRLSDYLSTIYIDKNQKVTKDWDKDRFAKYVKK
jgi:Leucine-rich repeat (LRR) protein